MTYSKYKIRRSKNVCSTNFQEDVAGFPLDFFLIKISRNLSPILIVS